MLKFLTWGGVKNKLTVFGSSISRLLNKAVLSLIDHFPLFLLLNLYLIFPGWTAMSDANLTGKIVYTACLFAGSFIFAFIFTLLAAWKRLLYWIILIVFTLIAFAELFAYFTQNTRICAAIIGIVLQTDSNEALNFLELSGSVKALTQATGCLIGMLLLFGALKLSWKRFNISQRFQLIIKKPFFLTFCNISALIACMLSVITNIYIWQISFAVGFWMDSLYSPVCNSILYQANAVQRVIESLQNWDLDKVSEANTNIHITKEPQDSLTVVYVIGESHNKYHSSLYGYCLPTDPKMKALHSDSSLFVFNNIITGYAATCETYPRLLSTHDIAGNAPLYDAPLLPAIMKKAGFTSEYFNNQSLITAKGFDFSANFLFSNQKIRQQCYSVCNDELCSNESLLPIKFRVGTDKKTFTTYHLNAQHVPAKNYIDTIFRPSDYQAITSYTPKERACVADYDNSSYQVDKLLGEIVNQIKDRNAILVYVSDHGERFYDYNHMFGRPLTQITPDIAKFIMEVPLYIYVSDKYKAKYPDRVAKLRASVHKPIYNTDIAHTIIDLAGIQTDAYKPELSLLTPGIYRKERIMPQYGVTYESMLPEIAKIKPVYPLLK